MGDDGDEWKGEMMEGGSYGRDQWKRRGAGEAEVVGRHNWRAIHSA